MEANILEALSTITLFDVVKWFLVVGMLMYSAFAFVVVRQVKTMEESLEDEFNMVVITVAWAHFAATILLTVLAVVVL